MYARFLLNSLAAADNPFADTLLLPSGIKLSGRYNSEQYCQDGSAVVELMLHMLEWLNKCKRNMKYDKETHNINFIVLIQGHKSIVPCSACCCKSERSILHKRP